MYTIRILSDKSLDFYVFEPLHFYYKILFAAASQLLQQLEKTLEYLLYISCAFWLLFVLMPIAFVFLGIMFSFHNYNCNCHLLFPLSRQIRSFFCCPLQLWSLLQDSRRDFIAKVLWRGGVKILFVNTYAPTHRHNQAVDSISVV